MKKRVTIVAVLVLVLVGLSFLTACGSRSYRPAASLYCVDNGGHIVDSSWCGGVGHPGYGYWSGNTFGHSYHSGQVIPRRYYTGGSRISQKAANALRTQRSTSSTHTSRSIPAKPQSGVSRPKSSSGSIFGGRSSSSSSRSSLGSSSRSSSSGGRR